MTKITRDQLLTRYTNSSVAVKFQCNKVSSLINPFQESLLKTCLPESCVYEENEEDITISEDDETFNNLSVWASEIQFREDYETWRLPVEAEAGVRCEGGPSFILLFHIQHAMRRTCGRWHHTAVRPTVILQKIDKKLVLHHFKLVRT